MGPTVSFKIEATMGERWVPHFLGMLREMQRNGSVGHSEMLRFYSDGDGDFRPRFEWSIDVEPADPCDCGDSPMWDAG